MKKEIVIFALVFVFVSMGFVGAAVCSTSSQIIFSSYSNTNSHAALWNVSSFTHAFDVCYNSLFGSSFNDPNPHDCKPDFSNWIFDIKTTSNSHAYVPATGHDASFIPVCYGTLLCRTAVGACNSDERLVVSLSSNYNAHVSLDNSYPVKICCRSGGVALPPTPPVVISSSVAKILTPKDRYAYYTNTFLNFTHASMDPAQFDTLWTVKENSQTWTLSNMTFLHSFTQSGQKVITLKITNKTSGKSSEDQASILVLSSPGILAYIGQPKHKEIVSSPNFVFNFSATSSYVVDSSIVSGVCGISVTCLAGDCPDFTGNSPASCGGNPLPIVPSGKGDYSHLYFNWKFDDGETIKGLGSQFSSGSKFLNPSASASDYKILVLNLSYNGVLNQSMVRAFTLIGDSQCLNGNTFLQKDPSTGYVQSYPIAQYPAFCKGVNGIAGDTDDCCPPLQACVKPSLFEDYRCVGIVSNNTEETKSCSLYTTQNSCQNDTNKYGSWDGVTDASRKDPNFFISPNRCDGSNVACRCRWDSTDTSVTPQGSCGLQKTRLVQNDTQLCAQSSCSYTATSQSECTSGSRSYDYNAQLITDSAYPLCPNFNLDSSQCSSGSVVAPCGVSSLELPFFGFVQFAIAGALVFVISFAIWFYNKN